MLEKEFDLVFQQMQKQLFEELVQTGSPNTEFKPLNPYALGGGGPKAGNNYFSPLTTPKDTSAASKRETLILNAQARPSITTKAKKPKATPYTGINPCKELLNKQDHFIQNYWIQGKTANFVFMDDLKFQKALDSAEEEYLLTKTKEPNV
ncbi:MAG: hypothetical protein WAV48_05065 [Candidatus Magasanikiibacteriota bacterium]